MTQVDSNHAQNVWWVLQEIKRILLKKNLQSKSVTFPIYILHSEPAIPTFKQQEEILSELQRKGTIRMSLIPQFGQVVAIGMDEYAITILQPQFDELFTAIENEVLKRNMKDYASSLEHFDKSLKSKISQVITILIQKYHLVGVTSNQTNNIEELKFPKADFVTNGVSVDDVEKVFVLLGKNIGFTPYFNESKSDVRIVFSPSVSAQNVVERLNELKQLVQTPNKELETDSTSRVAVKKVFPDNVTWENITIKFLDGHEAIIKAKDQTRHTNYEEMGFKNSKNKLPNKQWDFLRLLAFHDGELSWEMTSKLGLPKREVDSFKKKKQRLAEALKAYFQIPEDPFYDYKKERAYKIKIHLIPESGQSSQNELNTENDKLGIEEYIKEQSQEVYEKDSQ